LVKFKFWLNTGFVDPLSCGDYAVCDGTTKHEPVFIWQTLSSVSHNPLQNANFERNLRRDDAARQDLFDGTTLERIAFKIDDFYREQNFRVV